MREGYGYSRLELRWVGANCVQAVPCFDQPDLKSTWTVSLVADKELTCLSNMDVKEEKDVGNGKKLVTFNKTPLMSTYVRLHPFSS
jgi:aminopeptidase N